MDSPGIKKLKEMGYYASEWKHATAILQNDYPEHWEDLIKVLSEFELLRSHVEIGGGGKSPITQSLETGFKNLQWLPKNWDTEIIVKQTNSGKAFSSVTRSESPTHEVDHVKGEIALEIEWSNKDPFFDRDLNNFRLLFDLRVISVGIIVTKHESLVELFKTIPEISKDRSPKMKDNKQVYCISKFGTSSTWLHKLLPRIEGGGGGGCPLLVIAITDKQYRDK